MCLCYKLLQYLLNVYKVNNVSYSDQMCLRSYFEILEGNLNFQN